MPKDTFETRVITPDELIPEPVDTDKHLLEVQRNELTPEQRLIYDSAQVRSLLATLGGKDDLLNLIGAVDPNLVEGVVKTANEQGGVIADKLTPKLRNQLDRLKTDPVLAGVFEDLYLKFLEEQRPLKRMELAVGQLHNLRLFLVWLGNFLEYYFYRLDADGYKILAKHGGYNASSERELLDSSLPFEVREALITAISLFKGGPVFSNFALPDDRGGKLFFMSPDSIHPNGSNLTLERVGYRNSQVAGLAESMKEVQNRLSTDMRIVLPNRGIEVVGNYDIAFLNGVKNILKKTSDVLETNRALGVMELYLKINAVERANKMGSDYNNWRLLSALMVLLEVTLANVLQLLKTNIQIQPALLDTEYLKRIASNRDMESFLGDVEAAFDGLRLPLGAVISDKIDSKRKTPDPAELHDVAAATRNLDLILRGYL